MMGGPSPSVTVGVNAMSIRWWRRRGLVSEWMAVLAAGLLLCGASAGRAQLLPLASGGKAAASDTSKRGSVTAPDSPRASLSAFLELAGSGDFRDAAQYLDLSETQRATPGEGAQLARELSVVLDRYIAIDLDAVSGASLGDTLSGLPVGVQQLGAVPGPHDRRDPVRLVRQVRAVSGSGAAHGTARWVFSRSTVEHIHGWYDRLPDRWTLEHLPAALLVAGPLGIRWWQWLALPLLLVVSWGLGTVLGRVARGILGLLARRSASRWNERLIRELHGPFTLAAMMVVALGLLPWLSLDAGANHTIHTLIHALLVVALFWGLWRLVDAWREVMTEAGWARTSRTSSGLLALIARSAKAAVAVLGVVAVLAALGYPVAALLGGLGLGGLAFALAAQKTLENLFGAVSIGADRLFREGDTVTIEGVTGVVETIGLRSTRIRTPERTIVSMPNATIADAKIETFAPRDRMRFAAVLPLVYGTTAAQMRAVIGGVDAALRAAPRVAPETIAVFLLQLGPSSLDVQVVALFQTTEAAEFQRLRQDALLRIMDAVERAGTRFALPTQTVHIASLPAARVAADAGPQ